MTNWYVRLAARVVLYTAGITCILLATAATFDRTEGWAIALFVALLVFVEGLLGVVGDRWPPRRRGRADVGTVLVLAAVVAIAAPLGRARRVDEVSTVYLGPASLADHELRCREARW